MIANHKGEIPFVLLIIPFVLGICFGLNFFPVTWLIPIIGLLVLLTIIFITLNLTYQRFSIYKTRWLGGVLISLILFLFGCVSVVNYNELSRANHFSKTPARHLVVKISNEPVLKNGYVRFTANVEQNIHSSQKSPTSGTLLINLKDTSAKNLYYGDELLIPANYSPVDPPFNPAEFNYKAYLANQNIHYQSFLYPGQFVVMAHDAGNPIMAYSLRLRQRLVKKLALNMHDPQAIAVAATLLLGYKADLSNDVYQAYAKTGTAYVLSVSGAQVAIIYALLSLALGFLNRFKYGRLLKAIIIIALLSYYALLSGFSPAVCRAVLMLSLVLIGKTYNRYINTLNLLAASAFILLLYDPFYITTAGFQLSYLAIAGLIIFRPIIYKWFSFKNNWADKLWALCSVSIAAQVIIFPLSALYFHQFPVYFLLGNLLVVIPATVITYTGIIYLLLPQIPVLSNSLGFLLERSILLTNKMLSAIENTPFASINKIWINNGEYLLLYAIIISLFCLLYYKKTALLKLSLVCMLLLCISISLKKIDTTRSNSIAFLNMGKHVGIVMKHGNTDSILTDLTDTDKNYRYSIQPYLDSCQVTHINIYHLQQNVQLPYLLKRYNYFQFLNKKVVILNKQYSAMTLNVPLNTDYVYVTGNPYINIASINKNYKYGTLVIDGSNSNRSVSNFIQQAEAMHVNYALLKRNKSLLVVSN